jgi:hypothetical protein
VTHGGHLSRMHTLCVDTLRGEHRHPLPLTASLPIDDRAQSGRSTTVNHGDTICQDRMKFE